MTKALRLATELNDLTNKIETEYEETRKRVSQLYKTREDILHLIENSKMSACDGYKLSLSLQLLSKKRRQAKFELSELQSLRMNVTNVAVDITKNVSKINSKNNYCFERGIGSYTPKELCLDVNTIVSQVNKL